MSKIVVLSVLSSDFVLKARETREVLLTLILGISLPEFLDSIGYLRVFMNPISSSFWILNQWRSNTRESEITRPETLTSAPVVSMTHQNQVPSHLTGHLAH